MEVPVVKLLKKISSTEVVLFVLVVSLLIFKFSCDKPKVPVGDFGPSPHEKFNNSQDKNK